MKTTFAMCIAAAASAGLAGSVRAAGLDENAPIICAASEAHDCAPNSDCIRDAPEEFNLPVLVRLDIPGKKVVSKQADGEERSAEIELFRIENGRLILQGVQLGSAWSMVVTQETGDMSAAVTRDNLDFVVFGVCTNL